MPSPSGSRNAARTSIARSGFSTSPTQSIAKIALMVAASLPRLIHGRPAPEASHPKPFGDSRSAYHNGNYDHETPAFNIESMMRTAEEPSFWMYAGIAVALVVVGGIFAGLTLGLMGQDEIYLQVIEASGEGAERMHAKRVLGLLKRGKHWVLVTLLLSNVITNETLPIVLDRSLGGGWPAVVSSTVLIVIFGEIIPQSVCVRYGLAVGSYLSPFVLALMYLMYPVAYPTALLLDYILGEDHGTVYKKAGLKTLVTLHRTLGPHPSERLNQDEVTIISAVLDLKDKPVGSIMTPIDDVFTMSSEDVLDEKTMHRILSAGYSRIPIHAPGEPTNFVGMLLVKILITYDPEDAMKVKDFPLATLPETAPETSCLDIVNFFQEGKSHMVLVSSSPGENYGALGVVTLEDVIEELIGEEIVDESDVFIDVHKAIRRIHPSPLARRISSQLPRTTDNAIAATTIAAAIAGFDANENVGKYTDNEPSSNQNGPRRPSQQINGNNPSSFPPDVMQHLKHLGPSNLASNPKKTLSKTVKIKPGGTDDFIKSNSGVGRTLSRTSSNASATYNPFSVEAGRNRSQSTSSRPGSRYGAINVDGSSLDDPVTDPTNINNSNQPSSNSNFNSHAISSSPPLITFGSPTSSTHSGSPPKNRPTSLSRSPSGGYTRSTPMVKEPPQGSSQGVIKTVRSGSLIESVKTTGGIPKTVIETTSSEDEEVEESSRGKNGKNRGGTGNGNSSKGDGKGESSPLLKGWGLG